MIDADSFREFFNEHVGSYAEPRALRKNTYDLQVTVTLADGRELLVLAWRAGPGWIVLFTETDEMHTVPYETITRVSVQRRAQARPDPPPRRPPGFTTLEAEPAEEPAE
jgi:hypothetical protein